MEHDRRICPRCGSPAGDYRFCESCRSHLESLAGAPTLAGVQASASNQLAAQAGESSVAAVDVHPEPRPAETPTADTSEVAKLPVIAGDPVSDQPPREVARLEDVLTIAPAEERSAGSIAPPEHPSNDLSVEPAAEIDVLTTGLSSESDWARLRRQVARLEQLLSATFTDQTDSSPVGAAAITEPEYIAAQALREAFWFEQATAFKPNDADDRIARAAAALSASVPPPSEAEAQPHTQPEVSRPIIPRESRRTRLETVCLIALIGWVAVLTGRGLRRLIAG